MYALALVWGTFVPRGNAQCAQALRQSMHSAHGVAKSIVYVRFGAHHAHADFDRGAVRAKRYAHNAF